MVAESDTIPRMLRELENGLPLKAAFADSVFSELLTTVIPTIDLSAYDPDSNSGPSGATARNFGLYGDLKGIEPATATLTDPAIKSHVYILNPGGVAAGVVYVYRMLSLFCDAVAGEDWSMRVTGFTIPALTGLEVNVRVNGGTEANLLNRIEDLGTPSNQAGVQRDRPLIVYPGEVVTISSATTLVATTISRLSFIRERYLTAIVPVNKSADIDAAVI